ncbi:hypothetical protein [Niastella sp. OAS944]|uniref:hypothetical protein n=1 Tax=Niastella sp. OAS944 TaxID=2664089 RepID=UPI00347B5253|nr:hypothetical protein [Chitinophagaceae bacterium OAS944]
MARIVKLKKVDIDKFFDEMVIAVGKTAETFKFKKAEKFEYDSYSKYYRRLKQSLKYSLISMPTGSGCTFTAHYPVDIEKIFNYAFLKRDFIEKLTNYRKKSLVSRHHAIDAIIVGCVTVLDCRDLVSIPADKKKYNNSY